MQNRQLNAAEAQLLTRLGLQYYRVGDRPALYVRPHPGGQLSKSVLWDFNRNLADHNLDAGVGVGIEDLKDGHMPLASLPIRLYSKTGPASKHEFAYAAEIGLKKGWKTYEEASPEEREIQKTDPDILEARRQVEQHRLLNAAKKGVNVADIGSVLNLLGQVANNQPPAPTQPPAQPEQAQERRGPGRPPIER